jgi:hypothetical protein
MKAASLSVGVLLDHICSEIVSRRASEIGSRLMVHPLVYRCVAESRPQEVARGLPLMLLGLELTASEEIAPSSFRIAR